MQMNPHAQGLLANTVTIITGASAGVGWHTALLFAAQGSRIVAVARRRHKLEELASAIERAGGSCEIVAGDAALEETAAAAVAVALERFGRIDHVICNAGLGSYKQLVDTSVAEYDELMHANMRSGFVFAKQAAPHLIAQRSGSLVFISSIAGLAGAANEAVYCATKFAQVGFAQALDHELRPHGIKVAVLCPGGMKTEFALGKGRTPESIANSHMMEPADFAPTILFACTQPANVRIPQMVVRHMG